MHLKPCLFEWPKHTPFRSSLELNSKATPHQILKPGLDDQPRVQIVSRQENHARPTDCCGRSVFEVLALEDKVDVRAELDALSAWQG